MEKSREFTELTTKFLFINCKDGRTENVQHELNIILNHLNSLDYQKQKFIEQKTAARLLESFGNISTNEDTLIVKACCLILMIVNKQNVQLPSASFRKTIDWLLKCLNFDRHSIASDILSAIQALFRNHSEHSRQYWDIFLCPTGIFLNLPGRSQSKSDKYSINSSEEIILSVMLCIETIVTSVSIEEGDEYSDGFLATVGDKVIENLYSDKINFENHNQNAIFVTSGLNTLYKVISYNKNWCENHLGEMIGIAKSYMLYGLPGIPETKPQKILVSQQSVLEPVTNQNKGGKVAKTRKPRTISKNKRNDVKNIKSDELGSSNINNLQDDLENAFLSPFNRTSDSDFSESETGRSQNEKHKQTKLRLSAISLIGLIAKIIDQKTMHGYWHALFPSEHLTPTTKGILNCVLRDPNPRCRIAALQTTSLLLFGSKPYLIQAETSDKTPTSFMPFSISLGNMIIVMYDSLTQSLSTESSLPVLTQTLKCLSVLIQATPFHRLRSGFVTNFFNYVRQLVYHKDITIQVAALMVMEFLISVREITKEISECVGIPKNNFKLIKKNQNQLNDSGINAIIESENYEEIIDSDDDEEQETIDAKVANENYKMDKANISWLLKKVLENLGVVVDDFKVGSSTPIRIESLQVLSAMAPHILLLKDHLNLIALALDINLNDLQPEVRLYAGKCLDVIGHSINTYLLENGSTRNEDVICFQTFWTIIIPSVVKKIQDGTQCSSLKSVLCDFMSNIGVHIFERLPHATHIQLISLLSGVSCNDENTVRSAAVRALAVYVQFPSLREDLCFVENTAISVIQLMKDKNVYVRIKSSWSMGNISDALIMNSVDTKLDSISTDILRQMLEIAIESSGDNDKVRSNAVRTLGNLLRLITPEHLIHDCWRLLIYRAIDKLVQNVNIGNNAKVKWNSCYAIGNFMRNKYLFTNYKDLNWQRNVYESLCQLIINSTNFKVRINGAAALSIISERENYGNYLSLIWSSLLSALEQSDNLTDFNEYKHRDNLQEQLCLSLSHIIQISLPEDYATLKSELIPKLETTKQNWIRVINRILPENAVSLLSSSIKLKELLQNRNNLSNEQNISVKILISCFVLPEDEYF